MEGRSDRYLPKDLSLEEYFLFCKMVYKDTCPHEEGVNAVFKFRQFKKKDPSISLDKYFSSEKGLSKSSLESDSVFDGCHEGSSYEFSIDYVDETGNDYNSSNTQSTQSLESDCAFDGIRDGSLDEFSNEYVVEAGDDFGEASQSYYGDSLLYLALNKSQTVS